jgi:hypothetical protein
MHDHGVLPSTDRGRKEYATTAYTEQAITQELDKMGIDVFEPESRKEKTMAQALEAFSLFVLEEEKEKCQAIIDRHMGKSVGELMGGSEQHEVYRVLITDDENEAAAELLKEFHSSGKRYASALTIEKLQQYMLGMCEKRSRTRRCEKYTKLGNLMFILAFGPTNGQVRHIDNMDPNLQICLYMSCDCPSTIVYSMDGPQITNSNELVEHWGKNGAVPELVKSILQANGDTALGDKSHTKYFSYWDTIDANLKSFGKLYQPVSLQLDLQTDPGTTLMAGDNVVHAGPPTVEPRMFAFAIGIPEEDNKRNDESEDNNGEVQYNPVLLHLDLCCILFIMMDFEYSKRKEEHHEAKRFLLDLLLRLVKEFPKENHVRLFNDDRRQVRDWLCKLVEVLEYQEKVNILMQEAIESDSMFYGPSNFKKKRLKNKKGRNRNRDEENTGDGLSQLRLST